MTEQDSLAKTPPRAGSNVGGDVLATLGRRAIEAPRVSALDLELVPRRHQADFFSTSLRLFFWMFGAFRFLSGNLIDRLRGRASIELRADRLRRVMQSLGPTFVKLGQQLSIRADILPFEYCRELSKMLDKVPPFPVETALAEFERATGRRVRDTFAVFDPVPIGSASVGCVYQALLPDGRKVAVKIRRPGIAAKFGADLRALGWFLQVAETLSVVRRGYTRDLRRELEAMLFEELDYALEGRYTELFARRARKRELFEITAPAVLFELSADGVLVTEFAEGVLLYELLTAIDHDDREALAEFALQGIHPEDVARRMIRAFYWETIENVFFHADPHPANIVIRPGGNLVFIDFGSCGRFSSRIKRAYHQFQERWSDDDVSGMVTAAMAMLEPLPPLDLESFTREIEDFFWEWVYANKSKHSEWWERATGQMWMKFIAIARRYNVPMTIDILRMFRATFLYDSIAMRLHNALDMSREYSDYNHERGLRSRRRVRKALRRRLERGPSGADNILIEDIEDTAIMLERSLRRVIDRSPHRYFSLLGKASSLGAGLIRFLAAGLFLHLCLILAIGALRGLGGQSVDFGDVLFTLVRHPVYLVGMALAFALALSGTFRRLGHLEHPRR